MHKILTMKKLLITTALLLTIQISYSQDDWVTKDGTNYSVSYPNNWRFDTSGKMNTEFIIFSPLETGDTFSENINLLIQNLEGSGVKTMDDFIELSINQVKSSVTDGKIIKSERVNNTPKPYHKIIWSGNMSNMDLKFKQHIFIKDNKAIIVTYTATTEAFNDYIVTSDKILNSFTLN